MFDFIIEAIGIISAVVCGASFVASVTATPKDDELIGKLYIGKAKMVPPNKEF